LHLIQVRFKSNCKFSNGGLDLYAIKKISTTIRIHLKCIVVYVLKYYVTPQNGK